MLSETNQAEEDMLNDLTLFVKFKKLNSEE